MAPVERRLDADDGKAYTWEEYAEFYKKDYKKKAIEKAWEDLAVAKPKKGKAKSEKAEPEAKPKAKAKVKAAKKPAEPKAPDEPVHLTYFGVMAKGLAPALVAELSGRPWTSAVFKDIATEWQGDGGLKASGKCPFGQVPLLEVPARGRAPAQNIGQATAICNYLARIAKRKSGLEGDSAAEFAMSQMLMAEGEDLYNALQKNQTTVFHKEYDVGGKNTKEAAEKWWAEGAKAEIATLEKLIASSDGDAFTKRGTTVGEVYLFAMVHQMKLVHSNILDDAPGLQKWYDATKANAGIAKVLDSGDYAQYFMDH